MGEIPDYAYKRLMGTAVPPYPGCSVPPAGAKKEDFSWAEAITLAPVSSGLHNIKVPEKYTGAAGTYVSLVHST